MQATPLSPVAGDAAAGQLLALIDASPAKAVYIETLRFQPFDLLRAALQLQAIGVLQFERPGRGYDFVASRTVPANQGWFWVPPYRDHTQHHYTNGQGFLCGRKRPPGRPTFDPQVRGDIDYHCSACLAARASQFATILPAPPSLSPPLTSTARRRHDLSI